MSEGFRFVHLTDTHIMAGGLWHTRSGFDFVFDFTGDGWPDSTRCP